MPRDAASAHPHLPDGALAVWHVTATSRSTQPVFPDGCRDLIVSVAPHSAPVVFVTPLAVQVDTPALTDGQRLVGVRLQPGAQFDRRALLGRFASHDRLDEVDLLSAVAAEVRLDPLVREALQWLAGAPCLAAAGTSLGLSNRSLERLLMSRTGWTPVTWRRLARARRCALAILGPGPFAEIAGECGYADQAHMTRDLRRWFGASPTGLRRDPGRFAALTHSGFG